MNNLEATFSSPVVDYGYPLLFVILGGLLLWLTFSKNGSKTVGGLVDVAYVSVLLIVLWFGFLLTVAWFFGLLKFLIS